MTKQHLNCLPYEQAQQLIAIPKSSNNTLSWRKANNHNNIISEFVPQDARDNLGGTLAGATMQILYKPIRRIKDNDKLLITQFQLTQGIKYRVYQIEANHPHIISCRDRNKIIKGSHEHIGERVNEIPPLHPVNDLQSWFTIFAQKTNLHFTGTLPTIEHHEDMELQHTQ